MVQKGMALSEPSFVGGFTSEIFGSPYLLYIGLVLGTYGPRSSVWIHGNTLMLHILPLNMEGPCHLFILVNNNDDQMLLIVIIYLYGFMDSYSLVYYI